MEADCNIFLINLVYGFFQFDMPSISLQKQPPEVFFKERFLRNFAKLTEKHLYQSLFFNKVAGLRPQNTSGGCFCHLIYSVYHFQRHFHYLKNLYNNFKCVVLGISHEKLGLAKSLSACSPFPNYITGIRRYSIVTFTQSKVLLFWICLDIQDA